MKIWVDRFPKTCYVCPCYQIDKYHDGCNLGKFCIEHNDQRFTCRHANCPLQSIADHDVEVRKQVCTEIRHTVTLDNTDNGYLDQHVDIYNLYEILDKIERGTK